MNDLYKSIQRYEELKQEQSIPIIGNVTKSDQLYYKMWESQEIVDWIASLDKNRYSKYCYKLLINMQYEGIDGHALTDIDNNDLQRWGIVSEDKSNLLRHIKSLVNLKLYH